MTTPSDHSLAKASEESSIAGGQLSTLMRSLTIPTIARVLGQALNDGSLQSADASAALSADATLNAILRNVPPYITDTNQDSARDFNTLFSGSAPAVLETLKRLTVGFRIARAALQGAGTNHGDETVSDEVRAAITSVNAGYVLLIATVHSIMDTGDSVFRNLLFPSFQQLLEQDVYLTDLAQKFSDLRSARATTARKVALRVFFETFCAEAVQPTIYGDAISAVVQSILIRELKHVVAEEAQLEPKNRFLAPYLAELLEKRVRGEMDTARSADGKPQPVLQALRRCPAEAKGLMEAVIAFLLESPDPDSSAVSCEVMLSVGCLLPETRIVGRLTELINLEDLSPGLVLLFSSAAKFSCYLEDTEKRVDPSVLIQRGMQIVPQLSPDQRTRLVREVFAPLDDGFIEYLQLSPEVWETADVEFRAECIQSVLVPRIRLQLSSNTAPATIDRAADRAVAAALLSHLVQRECVEGTESQPDDGTSEPVAVEPVPATQPEADDALCVIASEPTVSASILPDLCLQWLVLKSEDCDVSPEHCTRIVAHLLQRAGGLESLGLHTASVDALLRRGGFAAIKLLSERSVVHARLAKLLGEYVPTTGDESLFIRKVFEEQFVDALRKLINDRATTLDSRQLAEAAQMARNEAQADTIRDRSQITLLSQQIHALEIFLADEPQFIVAQRDWSEARIALACAEQELSSLRQLTKQELVSQRKVGALRTASQRVDQVQAEIENMRERRFRISSDVKSKMAPWKADDIGFGQLHAMRDGLRDIEERVARVDQLSEEATAAIAAIDEQIAVSTGEIIRIFPLVRTACQSQAVRSIDPASLCLQTSGSDDLLGVMCRVHLVNENDQRPGSTANQRSSSADLAASLEREIRAALQVAFRQRASKPQSLAALTDLAELCTETSPLLKLWPECTPSSGNGAHVTVPSLQEEVSLLELLYRNIKYDLTPGTTTWDARRQGWDESFHAPLIRLFARLASQGEPASHIRQRALGVAFSGVTAWVARDQECAQIQAENARLPADQRRSVPSPRGSVKDVLMAWIEVLRVTKAIAGAGSDAAEKRKKQIRDTTDHLIGAATSLLNAASAADVHRCFIPAGRMFVKCAKDTRTALAPASEALRTFAGKLAELQQQELKSEGEMVSSSEGPEGIAQPRVMGLSFSRYESSTFALPPVISPLQRRLNSGEGQPTGD